MRAPFWQAPGGGAGEAALRREARRQFHFS